MADEGTRRKSLQCARWSERRRELDRLVGERSDTTFAQRYSEYTLRIQNLAWSWPGENSELSAEH